MFMRVGLLSDTHRSLENAYKAIEKMGSIDLLIHAGDHYKDALTIASQLEVPVHAVMGNCDAIGDGPQEKLLEIEGLSIFITHGHRYQVKNSLNNLYYRALELNARVAVYGHTHIAHIQKIEPDEPHGQEIFLINPGSIAEPRWGDKVSYGIIEIDSNNINPQIYYL